MAEPHPQRWRAFFETEQEVRRLFRELIHQPWGGRGQAEGGGRSREASAWQPQADIWETDEAIMVEVELPGVTRQDVTVEVEGDVLRVAGERRATVERSGRHYYQVERITGRFTRQWRLPHTIDRDAIEATFKDGILTLTLPKQPRS
jgi:HSP20 family molecular chaperone IbpA